MTIDALSKNDAKKKEISKDVSAFVKSNGGIIIYGLNESNHKASSFSFVNDDVIKNPFCKNTFFKFYNYVFP